MKQYQIIEVDFLESLFEPLADVVFCVKDTNCVYLSVNSAFVARAGVQSKAEMIGKRASDFFSDELAEVYDAQDREVFEKGVTVEDQLELIRNADGSVGWYLASKFPLRDPGGTTIGLVGISQDLHTPSDSDLELSELGQVVEFIKHNLEQPLRIEQIASQFELSTEQLDRRMKRVYRLSTKKYIMKSRLEKAASLLKHSDCSLVEVASRCGFRRPKCSDYNSKQRFQNTAAYRNG
ncbi:MAG: AraC family transcriptional regulator [Pirellulaceae bacterium]